jgi:hypothetical protein
MHLIKRKILPLFMLLLLHVVATAQNPFQTVRFIENKGQWEPNVLYMAHIPDGYLYIENNTLTYYFYDGEQYHHNHHLPYNVDRSLDYHVIKLHFERSNADCKVTGNQPVSERYNFFIGKDKENWASNIRAFRNLTFYNIYQGIDLEIFSEAGILKYNVVVHPEGNVGDFKIRYEGVEELDLNNGELYIKTSVNEFYERIPNVYKVDENGHNNIPCFYELNKNIVSFNLPLSDDLQSTVVIDPVIIFSTFSGSWADNFGYTATYDDSGYAYSAGTVFFDSFPATSGAFQKHWAGGVPGNNAGSGGARDAGILKYSPDGSRLIYATYLGGSGNEDPHSMVINSNFELLVFGNTNSSDFPIGNNFYDSSFNGNYDIYVARLSKNGSQLLSSTYIGGSDEDAINGYFQSPSFTNQSSLGHNYGDAYRGEINVNGGDTVYVVTTTKSNNFPVAPSAFQNLYGGGIQDACVIALAPDLSNLVGSTFLGGNLDDAGYGIDFRSDGTLYVCGGTKSTNLPVGPVKYQAVFQGGDADGYIFHLSKDLKTRYAATYFGTDAYDQTYFVQTDRFDNVYVTGQTKSKSFPVKNVNYSNTGGTQFITKLNSGLDSIVYSTVFGSGRNHPDLSPSAFLVDRCERVYFSGWGGETNHTDNPASGIYDSRNYGWTTNLPLKDAHYNFTDGSDFYIAVFSREINDLLYATYFGDPNSNDHVDGGTSRFDKKGVIYQSVCAGCNTSLSTFPTTSGSWAPVKDAHRPGSLSNTGCNNALFKINLDIPDLHADFDVDTIFCLADSTTIVNKSIGGKEYFWDFGVNGISTDTSSSFQPRFSYPDTGTYKITLIIHNSFSCDLYDTVYKYAYIYNQAASDFEYLGLVCKNHFQFVVKNSFGENYLWDFGDGDTSSLKNPSHNFPDTGLYNVLFIVDKGTVCEHRTQKQILVKDLPKADFDFVIDTCEGLVTFTNNSINTNNFLWDFGDGDTSTLRNPRHTYRKADKFYINLYAEPNEVCTDSIVDSVEILTPPANIELDIDTCNYLVSFYNPSTYAYKASIWDLGNDSVIKYIDTINNYHYTSSGKYTIVLNANVGTLCENTVDTIIELPELPEAKFEFKRENCSPQVSYYNNSKNSIKYIWDLDEGIASSSKDSVVVSYDSSGNKIVFLIAESINNCVDTFIDTVPIDHLAHAEFQ